MKKILLILFTSFTVFLSIIGIACGAANVTFEWDSNIEADMSHYNIYQSTDNQSTWDKVNPNPIPHIGGGTESWTLSDVADGNYA
jgi:hypothetical protein